MQVKSTLVAGLSLLAIAATTHTASASVTVYTNKAAFLAAINADAYTESFNSAANGPSSLSYSGGTGATPYKFTASTTTTGGNYFYPYTANGDTDQSLSTAYSNQPIYFTVQAGSKPITAMGGYFFNGDIGSNLVTTSVPRLTTDLNAAGTYAEPTTAGFKSFVGFTSTTPFTMLTAYENPTSNQFVTANDLIVGTALAVPEPTSLGLIGLAATALLRRRNTRA